MCRSVMLSTILVLSNHLNASATVQELPDVEQVTVFQEEGRFAGWPANHGIWSWGDEILVRFNVGWLKDMGEGRHAYDKRQGPEMVWARSLDGGRTWSVDRRESYKDRAELLEESRDRAPSSTEQRSFLDPDMALFIKGGNWRYSANRGRDWGPWYALPDSEVPLSFTSYLIQGAHEVLAIIGSDGISMSPIMVFSTEDAGTEWNLTSSFGEPSWYEGKRDFISEPSVTRSSATDILVATRRGEPERIETYRSGDNGSSWTLQGSTLAESGGTMPNLFGLSDGRVVLIYGYRTRGDGSGIRAKISEDMGQSWGDEFVLRGNAGNWDLGYPLTVQRQDGRLVTVYYFNDDPSGERYIGATIWTPPSAHN